MASQQWRHELILFHSYLWSERFAVNIVWSPLYTAFYGSVFALTKNVYAATTLHRIIIVIAVTLGVLAVMRKLLPPVALALLVASWWAILPINFDTLSEVHLFALLPGSCRLFGRRLVRYPRALIYQPKSLGWHRLGAESNGN